MSSIRSKREIQDAHGVLDFGAEYTQSMLDKYANLSSEDKLATITAFSSEAIARAFSEFILPTGLGVDRLIASGGGVRNATLMTMIAERLPEGVKLETSDVIGIPPQYKEAIKFATIAFYEAPASPTTFRRHAVRRSSACLASWCFRRARPS